MTVEELIKHLRKVKNKQADVIFMTGKDSDGDLVGESVDYLADSNDTNQVILF